MKKEHRPTTVFWPHLRREEENLTEVIEAGQKSIEAYKSTVLSGIYGVGADEENAIALNGNIKKIGSKADQLEFSTRQPSQLEFPRYQPSELELPERHVSQSKPRHQIFQLELPAYLAGRAGEDMAWMVYQHLQEQNIESACSGRWVTFTLDAPNLQNMEKLLAAQKERAGTIKRSPEK